MRLIWTSRALSDLGRLHDFLAPHSRRAAAHSLARLRLGALKLVDYPRIGERLAEIEDREVRRILVGDYEIRYELGYQDVHIVRVFHTREDR